MKSNIAKIASSLAVAFLALGVASPVSATTNQDFDTAGGTPFTGANFPNPTPRPAPTVVAPDAFSTGNYLRLLSSGSFNTQNGVGFDLSDAGSFNRIIADFDFRITCKGTRFGFFGGGCADGFSFLLLDTAVHGASGATGAPTLAEHGGLTLGGQFSLGFNTFLNPEFVPDAGSSNSLSMLVNNSFVPGSFIPLSTATFNLATGTFGAKGRFHHAQIDLVLGPGTPKVTVTLTNGISGLVITPFLNFDLSAVAGLGPVERRVGSAARCGAACAEYNLDNINVQYLDPVATEVAIDINPTSCPNPLNVNSKGVLPVAILSTANFDATQVDLTTVTLEGVSPLRSNLEDVATPFNPFTGKQNPDDCNEEAGDGLTDLTLKFDRQAVVGALGPVNDGDVIVVSVSGKLLDGTTFNGEDVIVIKKKK